MKIFSTGGVSGVKNFKYMFSGFFSVVCGLIRLSSWLLWWFFNLWFGPGFIFESCN
jgi:hypothetical protein